MLNQYFSEHFTPADEVHIKRERQKARELRGSQWWRNELGRGVCYHCGNRFTKDVLTMDHLIPIVRGGKTSKSNVVVSCKECNSRKKYHTPVELTFQSLSEKND